MPLLGLAGSCNPFAPAYDSEGLNAINSLGDRSTIEGMFRFFKNSYELRDTSLYGKLFTPDFTFNYYDFDNASTVTWDKAQELALTYNLFRSARTIQLDWNYYIEKDSTALEASVIRNFNLTIIQQDQTTFTGSGRARLKMRRNLVTDPWKIWYWFDDSDF